MLRSFPSPGRASRLTHFGDNLRNGSGIAWSHLMVENAAVLKRWPFQFESIERQKPGRPSPWPEPLEREFLRRCQNGIAEKVLKQEAAALNRWLKSEHPEAAAIKPATIAGHLRAQHREKFSVWKNISF